MDVPEKPVYGSFTIRQGRLLVCSGSGPWQQVTVIAAHQVLIYSQEGPLTLTLKEILEPKPKPKEHKETVKLSR